MAVIGPGSSLRRRASTRGVPARRPMSLAACFLALLALSLTVGAVVPAQAEKRVALLIGNNAYESVPKLLTAVNDVRAVGARLRELGFSVSIVENQSRRAMSEALLAFDKAIQPGDIAFFYFAGHGFEISGQNYLLPTDAPDVGEGQQELLRDSSFFAGRIVERLQARGAGTVVLVLDACRNNPFERAGRRGLSGSEGLAAMTPAEGVFIMYSAGAKQTALDQLPGENSANSVFTRLLVKKLAEPDLTLVRLAKELQVAVRQLAARVGHEQTPAYYDQVVGDVVLNRSGRAPPVATQPPGPLPQPPQSGPQPPPAPPAKTAQAVSELDALAAAESWRELTAHLTEVPPTARDSHWAALAEQAVVGDLTAPSQRGNRLAAVDDYLATFPSLKKSQKFLALRASIGLETFGQCFSGYGAGECLSGLEAFVHATPQDNDLALKAAQLVARNFNRAAAAVSYAVALETPAQETIRGRPEAVCSDTELVSVVIPALSKPAGSSDATAAKLIADKCWDALNGAIVAQVAREQANASYFLPNICPKLLERKALTGLRAAICREVVSR